MNEKQTAEPATPAAPPNANPVRPAREKSSLPGASTATLLLELGRQLHLAYGMQRANSAKIAEQLGRMENELIRMCQRDRKAKALLTHGATEDSDLLELRVLAVTAYNQLLSEQLPMNVAMTSHVCCGRFGHTVHDLLEVRRACRALIDRGLLAYRQNGPDIYNGQVRVTTTLMKFLRSGMGPNAFFTESEIGTAAAAGDTGQAPLTIPTDGSAEANELAEKHTARWLCLRVRRDVHGDYLDPAIRTLSGMMTVHLKRARMIRAGRHPGTPNQIALIAGPSSAGKTFLAETMGRACGIPFSSFSATDVTAEGYVGCSVEDSVIPLLRACRGNPDNARYGFCLIDEFDKKAVNGPRGGLDISGRNVQEAYLRILQGCEFPVGGRRGMSESRVTFNSDGTAFALAGAFVGLDELLRKGTGRKGAIGFTGEDGGGNRSRLRDALTEFGLIPELTSRLGCTILLKIPGVSDLITILKQGVMPAYRSLLKECGIELAITTAAMEKAAEWSHDTGTYARGLQTLLNSVSHRLVFELRRGRITMGAREISEIIDAGIL